MCRALGESLPRHAWCATRELAAVFELTDDETEVLLEELEAENAVRRQEAGRNVFWDVPPRE